MANVRDFETAIRERLRDEAGNYEGFDRLAKLYLALTDSERDKMVDALAHVIASPEDSCISADAIHLSYNLRIYNSVIDQAVESRAVGVEPHGPIGRQATNYQSYRHQSAELSLSY